MRLRISNFCGLSRNQDWHTFLGEVAPDILKNLQAFLKANTGCKDAKDKMLQIYRDLYSKGLGNTFEDFIRKRFPYIIEFDDQPPPKAQRVRPKQKLIPPSGMNRHGVFKTYKPSVLTFPHKLILVDNDTNRLLKKVKEFLIDKVPIDYIVIGDTAYIEYLQKKYSDIVSQIPDSAKEIQQFRKKMAQK